ncbi:MULTISPECIES: 4Fe-4S dicluster domain-containing protein [unclassified Photobacterium]|uniref:4Fe-4S dicluster domain-containing protein n=1 Tax=unclassified Photobacterium TaxID=2628852 RepID=UPI000D16477F|nr:MULTISPECIES: 4Fe-4S dicluster domain-containing protein [unclassified Photobacterium]PSV29269.1 ferredoxin-type protein NapF [Photobacterium sp. GB-72]PSV57376.1 ferredoxin-type protein NapF [Photobacterium sp. GB-3]
MKTDSTESMPNEHEINHSRRGLFRALSRGVSQSADTLKADSINTGRPLGAVEESLFSRLCNNCEKCVAACPQNILAMGTSGPVMDLSFNHCTFCQACIHACDTQALNTLNTTDTGWRPTFSKSCNAKIFDNCQECVDDCPKQALSLIANSTPILNDGCNGCGECLSSCYIGAVS